MITVIIMVLAALVGVWLLAITTCTNTHFIAAPRDLIARIFARKTRRGWENVAVNAETGEEGQLADNEKDAMLRELLDLDHNADDDDVRDRFAEYGSTEGAAENAQRAERRKAACNALGIGEDADAELFHNAVLSVPTWLQEERTKAANATKVAIKAVLDLAIHEGRLLAPQREVYETAFNSDFEGTLKKLAREEKKLNTERLNMSGRKEVTSNAQELGVQVKEAAAAYQEKHKCDFATAWNAQKKEVKFKAYFEQSKGAA